MTALRKIRHPRAEIAVSGLAGVLDLSGAMYLPEHDALLVADLHLEKGSSFASRGQLLPPYDTRETLVALSDVIARFEPGVVIALGDSFHDVGGPDRLGGEERAALRDAQSGRQWIWVTGNHDRTLPRDIGGEVMADLPVGPVILRHEPQPGARSEIAGHLHPVGKVVMRGRGVRRRCFATDGARCVLPAFGAYAGGLNVCDAAFKPLFPAGFAAHLIGTERIFAIAKTMLCRD